MSYPIITQLQGSKSDEITRSVFVIYLVQTSATDSVWMRQPQIRAQYKDKGWEKMIKQYIEQTKPVKVKREEQKIEV